MFIIVSDISENNLMSATQNSLILFAKCLGYTSARYEIYKYDTELCYLVH